VTQPGRRIMEPAHSLWHFGWRTPRPDEQKSQPQPRALSQALENAMAPQPEKGVMAIA
jgi:hypothetical protein